LNGTINRALLLNATKSIKIILEYVIEHENNHLYNNLIMLDIIPIIERRNFEINLFFCRSQMEIALNKNENLCCFETLLTNQDLPGFSNKSHHCEFISTSNIFLEERNSEMSKLIIDREAKTRVNRQDMKYKVEHFYINFSLQILYSKIKSKDEKEGSKMN
jgi:hypothetical protein